MLVVLVALGLVTVVLAVSLVRAVRGSSAQQAVSRDLEGRLAVAEAARSGAEGERDTARADAEAAVAARGEASDRAVMAEAAAEDARGRMAEAELLRRTAEASVSEAATLAARLIDDGAADPAALWALERARTERTWRHSVAAVPGDPSPLVGARHPLWTALEIEVAAVREEVGAVVDLDVDLPDSVTAGASLATLRVAQELLAVAARRGEITTLRVSSEGHDVVVAVESVDEAGQPIPLAPLPVPPSRIEADPGGVRLRGALTAPVALAP